MLTPLLKLHPEIIASKVSVWLETAVRCSRTLLDLRLTGLQQWYGSMSTNSPVTKSMCAAQLNAQQQVSRPLTLALLSPFTGRLKDVRLGVERLDHHQADQQVPRTRSARIMCDSLQVYG